jgi:hypothetical protein
MRGFNSLSAVGECAKSLSFKKVRAKKKEKIYFSNLDAFLLFLNLPLTESPIE